MKSKRIHIKVSSRLLEVIDEAAKANLTTRSDFIRESVVMRLNDQQLTQKPKLDEMLELLKNADNWG